MRRTCAIAAGAIGLPVIMAIVFYGLDHIPLETGFYIILAIVGILIGVCGGTWAAAFYDERIKQ